MLLGLGVEITPAPPEPRLAGPPCGDSGLETGEGCVEGEELSKYVLYVASVLEEELFVAILRGQRVTEKKWEGEPGLEVALYYSR